MNKGQYFDKHRNLQLEMQELERKWRLYYDEQRLLEAALQARNIVGMSPMSSGGGAIVNSPIYLIQSYTAGTSTIDFTNNGGDDWNIGFKIAMTSPQLPSGCTAQNYDVNVYFYVAGYGTAISVTTGETVDKTVNASGNGACVYHVEQIYNVVNSVPLQVGFIAIQSLFKVDASGTLLAYFKCNGITVNSVSGLDINVTANVEQSESYAIEWYSYDISFTPTFLGTGLTASLTLPTDCAYLIAQPILDSVFTTDFPSQTTTISTVTIN